MFCFVAYEVGYDVEYLQPSNTFAGLLNYEVNFLTPQIEINVLTRIGYFLGKQWWTKWESYSFTAAVCTIKCWS